MYITDKAIKIKDDDRLGRLYFTKKLADAILAYNSTDTLTIGLYGSWGTGKTSIINLLVDEFNSEYQRVNGTKWKVIIFEPWNYIDEASLINQFFGVLVKELKVTDSSTLTKEIIEIIEEYLFLLLLVPELNTYGFLPLVLKKSLGRIRLYLDKRINEKNNLQEVKCRLVKKLSEYKSKIVIVIDDIDRLSNDKIKLIFQLINSIANFPNIIYVLPMDKEIVAEALKDMHKGDGNEFLEKIINVPFVVPYANKSKIQNILLDMLNEIQESQKNHNLNLDHWKYVYKYIVEPNINTLRDVKRILNVFQFYYSSVSDEVDFSDLFAITILQITKPNIYYWILKNKMLLFQHDKNFSLNPNEVERDRNELIQSLNSIDSSTDNIEMILACLFPKLGSRIGLVFEGLSDGELRRQCRIGHEDKFDIYFEFNIQELEVNNQLVRIILDEYSMEEIVETLEHRISKKSQKRLLQEMLARVDVVNDDRANIIIEALLRVKYDMYTDESESISFSAEIYTDWVVIEILKKKKMRDKMKDNFHLIIKLIKDADLQMMHSLFYLINTVELAYGRLVKKEINISDQIVELSHLEEIEDAYANRLERLFVDGVNFLALRSLIEILYLWKSFDSSKCNKYISKILTDSIIKLRFITRFAMKWTGSGGYGWSYNESYYSDFISKEEVVSILTYTDYSIVKKELNDDEIIKLAYFLLDKSKPSRRISISKVWEIVNKWDEEGEINLEIDLQEI